MTTDSPTVPAREPAIELTGVSKSFRLYKEHGRSLRGVLTGFHRARPEVFWALSDVSFTVPKGSITSIIGHNGSGKSTMLRVLAGVYRPTNGQVITRGRVTALLELGAGFHDELSGRENIYMNGAIMGMEREDIDAIADSVIGMADIGQFIDSPVEVYSSGMRARLGFAISVHLDPEILLLDEIISVGDARFERQCREHLARLVASGMTIVIVSHDLALVQRLSDQVVWLDHGQVRAIGEPVEIVHEYLDYMTGASDELDRGNFPEPAVVRVESLEGNDLVYAGLPVSFHVSSPLLVDAAGIDIRFRYQQGEMPFRATVDIAGIGLTKVAVRLPALPLPPGRYAIEARVVGAEGEVLAGGRAPIGVRPADEDVPPVATIDVPVELEQRVP